MFHSSNFVFKSVFVNSDTTYSRICVCTPIDILYNNMGNSNCAASFCWEKYIFAFYIFYILDMVMAHGYNCLQILLENYEYWILIFYYGARLREFCLWSKN